MSVISIIGAQWGDEGKGRIVDYLATDADVVIRYQASLRCTLFLPAFSIPRQSAL